MCFRKSMNPGFPVVPIIFPCAQVNATFLKTYEPFEFNEIQRAMKNIDEGQSPKEIARTIAEIPALASAAHAAPHCTAWVQDVADLLNGLEPLAFQRAAPPLKLDLMADAAADMTTQSQRLSWAVANLLHQADDASVCYDAFANLLGVLSGEKARRLCRYLTAKWVTNQSVEMLLHALRQPDTHGWLTLGNDSLKVVECYRNRAVIELLPRGATIYKISVPDMSGDFDDPVIFIALVENALRATFGEVGEEEDLSELVADYFAPANCYAICDLPAQFNRGDVIENLRKHYPRIVFLIRTKNRPPALPEGARLLKPELSRDEARAFEVIEKRYRYLLEQLSC